MDFDWVSEVQVGTGTSNFYVAQAPNNSYLQQSV